MSRIGGAEKAVLYPVHIEAIMVGDNSLETANINEDYGSLSYRPAGENLVQDTFTSSQGEYDAGIYLHFILTDEWTHGQQMDKGDVEYPSLPDRWVVTRFAVQDFPGRSPKLLRRDWIIESNALFLDEDQEDNNTLTAYEDPRCPYRLLGRVREYDGRITAEEEHLKPFTAVSRGLDYFTGYYPECRTVLGFCDSLEDLEIPETQGQERGKWRLTYAISGWVEDEEDRADEALSVCHGLITDLNWRGSSYEYETGIPYKMDMPRAAVGNSLEEALAALLKFHGGKEASEDLLQHLFYNTLWNLEELDGDADGKQKIHQGQFLSAAAPQKTVLEGKEIRYTRKKGALLGEISQVRRELCQRSEEIQELCQEIYLLWIKSVRDPSFRQEAAERIHVLYGTVLRKRAEYLNQKEKEAEPLKELQKLLEAEPGDDREEIKTIPGDPYWLPKDLTILLEGAAQSNVYKTMEQMKKDGKVFTRTEKDIMTRLRLTVRLGGKEREFDIAPDSILREAGCPSGYLPPLLEKLAGEGLLMARSCIFYYGETIHRIMGIDKDSITMTQLIQTWEEGLLSPERTTGKPPSPMAVHIWRPSWNPLLLEWMLRYYPDPGTREGKCDLSAWTLEGDDYVYGKSTFSNSAFEILTGRSVLSFDGADRLTDLFASCAKEEEARRQLQKVKSLRLLSQKMQGMTEAMAAKDSSLLVAPGRESPEARDAFACLEQGWTDGNLKTNPPQTPFEHFHAVRAGRMEISGIRVIDSFGRMLDYDRCEVVASSQLSDFNVTKSFWLRPRILAPMRLSASWNYIPTTEEGEETTPVYGWLWPNIMDSCLHIYKPDGEMAGSVQTCYVAGNGQKAPVVQLRNPPGETKTEAEILDSLNERLRGFLTGFLAVCRREPLTLSEMVMILDESMWDIRADGIQSQSDVYGWLGHPIALMGVKIRIERKGSAPAPMEYTREKRYKSRLDTMKLYMRVGEAQEQKDGTIGVFRHGTSPGYDRFYPCKSSQYRSSYFGENTMMETFIGREEEMTILCSPYGKIKFTTGLMPVKEMKLNERMVEKALERIYLTLYCAPVLTEEPVRLLLPSALEKEWKFLEYGRGREKKVTADIGIPWTDAGHEEEPVRIKEGWLMLYAERRNRDGGIGRSKIESDQ